MEQALPEQEQLQQARQQPPLGGVEWRRQARRRRERRRRAKPRAEGEAQAGGWT